MPIGIDPNDTFSVKSSIDSHLPDEQRAAFKVRAISVADARKVARLVKEAQEQSSLEGENAKLNEALLVGIAGWENVKSPFGEEGLDVELSGAQKYDLAREYPSLAFIGEIEKKASRSRRVSGAEKSAKPVGAESAMTNPLQETD